MSKSGLLSVGVIAIGLLSAIPAQASLVVSTAGGDLNPTGAIPGGPLASYTDFSTVSAPLPVGTGQSFSNFLGGTVTFSGDGAIETGSANGMYAQPAGSVGNFLSTGYDGSSGTFTTDAKLTGEHNYVGLYWGSIDTYNTFNLFNGTTLVGTVVGNTVGSPANGDQASGDENRYVNITSTKTFDMIQFISTSPAFEVTNIALTASVANVAPVPEASTWAMMILGFLGLGFLGYRKSSKSSSPTFRMA